MRPTPYGSDMASSAMRPNCGPFTGPRLYHPPNDMQDRSYPKAARLLRKGCFRRVLSRGEVHPGRQALVRRLGNERGRARLGISTPWRYGKAHRRNRFRRLVREAFREIQTELGAYDYLVSPRRGLAEPTLDGITRDLIRTLTATPAPPRKRHTRERR